MEFYVLVAVTILLAVPVLVSRRSKRVVKVIVAAAVAAVALLACLRVDVSVQTVETIDWTGFAPVVVIFLASAYVARLKDPVKAPTAVLSDDNYDDSWFDRIANCDCGSATLPDTEPTAAGSPTEELASPPAVTEVKPPRHADPARYDSVSAQEFAVACGAVAPPR
jgi:hypothetical protein